jgi:hypothetical protein
MIIAQLLLPCASEYERKSQAIDFAALSAEHQIALGETEAADIVHVYGPSELDPRSVRDLRLPTFPIPGLNHGSLTRSSNRAGSSRRSGIRTARLSPRRSTSTTTALRQPGNQAAGQSSVPASAKNSATSSSRPRGASSDTAMMSTGFSSTLLLPRTIYAEWMSGSIRPSATRTLTDSSPSRSQRELRSWPRGHPSTRSVWKRDAPACWFLRAIRTSGLMRY